MGNNGLSSDYGEGMSKKLNAYLSNTQIAYMNIRGLHWNISGSNFFMLHEKFEEIYNMYSEWADETAERILMLGGTPLHSYSEYLQNSNVKERTNISDEKEAVKAILADMNQLLGEERELMVAAADNNDEGTAGLISGYIAEHEKLNWMLSALLEK